MVGDGLRMRIRIEESWLDARRCELGIQLAADFADIEEAHTGERKQQAPVRTEWDGERQELRFVYDESVERGDHLSRLIDAANKGK